VISTFHAQPHSIKTSSNNLKLISSNVKKAMSPTPPIRKTFEVNFVQSTPSEKINPKKERVRTRKIKIIGNLRSPKPNLLTIGINTNPDTLVLFVAMITTRRIVQDEPSSLSSFKRPRNHTLWPYCHNPSLLNKRPNWSFMTNLPPLIHPMS
jgi:hypothetical protein